MAGTQKADPAARRTVLIIVSAGILIGALLMSVAGRLMPMVAHWITQDLRVRSRLVFAGVTAATTGPTLAAAAYFWRFGQRIVWAQRYPPPGVTVFWDTVVVTGSDSRRRGRLMQATAVTLGVAGILLAFFVWRVLFLLEPQ
jgi:hypothetical protein